MKQLIATQVFTYADLPLKVGDRFEASDEDAFLLVGLEKAKHAEPRRPSMHQAAMKSDDLLGDVTNDASGKRRGRYKRSDMRAED